MSKRRKNRKNAKPVGVKTARNDQNEVKESLTREVSAEPELIEVAPAQDIPIEPERAEAPPEQPAPAGKDQVLRNQAAELSQKARAAGAKALDAGRAAAAKVKKAGGPAAAKAWESGRAAASRGWKAACKAGEAAWEKTSTLTAGSWDKAGRAAAKVRGVVARHPISPLLYVTILAIIIGVTSFQGMYTRAYVLNVNGEDVAILANEEEKDAILGNVETRVSSILGEDYDYDAEVSLTPVYTTPEAFSDAAEVEDTLFDDVGALIEAYGISVDGTELGYAATKDELYQMLDDIAQPYLTEDAIRYEFVEDVQIYPVELPSNTQFDTESIRATLTALEVEEAVYTVKKGDTFNAIAYSLDMYPDDLAALNPEVIVDKLWVDQELVIQQAVPYLSVVVTTDETYESAIESPVEYIETADLYVGNTKVKTQGTDGLALINAQVTYLNGVETEREIIESTTLVEPTTTYIYTGTTPRPVTASTGSYIWPVRGKITSRFGYRNIFGSTSYHSGIDIACPYGTAIKAADGGKVTFAGYQGSYGNLVVITHDNGTQTYYAHNSSLLVSVGTKVYQGQVIAKAGMTGRATGYHCHFEVRVNGTRVNPMNYL